MRRPLVLALCAIALVFLSGASAATTDWSSLPYFDALTMREHMSTEASWSGAKAVDAGRFNLLQPSTSWPKLKRQWIWSPTCGQAAQRVVFSKTILVPGEPLEGNLDLNYGPGNQFFGGRPYVSATFLVNGIEIGRLGDIAHNPRKAAAGLDERLSIRDRKAFRYGPNTLTIRVERAALKKGEQCTRPAATSGASFRYVAIAADLDLAFGSDLQAVPPATAQQVKKDVKSGDTITLQGTLAFQNAGPSASIGGTLQASVGGDGTTAFVTALTFPEAPVDKSRCTLSENQIICKYEVLPAGYSLRIHVGAAVKANVGFFRGGMGKLTIMWSITGPGQDPGKSPNNSAQTVVIMCQTGATDPACA